MMSLTLTQEDWENAAERLNVPARVIRTIAKVEGRDTGFLPSGRPKILFEGHYFHRLTGGKFSAAHPTISHKSWTRRYYLGGEREWLRLEAAMKLDREAALKSASWGQFQIMGANYKAAGYDSVEAFVDAMKLSAQDQIAAFCHFLEADKRLIQAIRNQDWSLVAFIYNGKANVPEYSRRLKETYAVTA